MDPYDSPLRVPCSIPPFPTKNQTEEGPDVPKPVPRLASPFYNGLLGGSWVVISGVVISPPNRGSFQGSVGL